MNTVEASLVMSVIIFAIIYMMTFSFSFTRKTNNYLSEEIKREHTYYTKNNKNFCPDDAKRLVATIEDYIDVNEKKEENNNDE